MVDHGCCREPSLCFATHTQRMPAEVRLAEPLPLAAVATLGGRRSVWVQGLMLRTVQTICQIGTAGGACRASYISSAQQSQPLQLSSVSAESFFNAFWYCSFTQATLSFSSSAMASHVAA